MTPEEMLREGAPGFEGTPAGGPSLHLAGRGERAEKVLHLAAGSAGAGGVSRGFPGARAGAAPTPGEDPLAGRPAYRAAKRAFDVAFSLLVTVGLSWLYLLIALAVKLDDPSGPAVFRQRRVGLRGRGFEMYKFRTMCPDAEARLEGLRHLNEKDGPVFKMADDPRVTRVGRLLRRTGLDELPQFWNVLRGDMSVVGPRPALPAEVAQYDGRQARRLLVRPGITCHWQACPDRDEVGFDEWVDMDLRYVGGCGPWTDLKLIARTVGCVLTAQGR
jgi:lipopolysaccharide/colanic/teichoic acid biosynthesis glycosyltransferase